MAEETQAAKRRRSTLKGKFHRIYNRFKELRYSEDKCVLKNILTDMNESYKELEMGHAKFIELLDPEDDTDAVNQDSANQDMDKMYGELCECRIIVNRVSEDSKDIEKNKQKETVKVKRLDAPNFQGEIRQFPSFKRDYAAIMVPTYGSDPFALKKSLSGEALKIIQGVDNDYHEMWKRLELKYGTPERLTDAILSDIRALKVIADGDQVSFINSVDTIERCYLDLKRVDMAREMNTTTMMSEIEKLLPTIQKREWVLHKKRNSTELSGKEIFLPLLNFLLEEKYAMEYMRSEIRNETKNTAKVNHINETSSRSATNELSAQVKQNQETLQKVVDGLAHITGIVNKVDRPMNFQNHNPMNYQNYNQMSYQNNNRPVRTKKYCWYHDYTDTHDITECWSFTHLHIDAKYDLMRKNGGCYICLKLGHISKDCPNKRKCEHCGLMHHTTLHQDQGHPHAAAQGKVNSILQVVNGDYSRENVLLMISAIDCKNDKLTTLWDPGSNISLISTKAANKLNLQGQNVTLSVSKVGNSIEHLHSKEYIVPLSDKSGKIWNIRAYGMETITANALYVDLSGIPQLFKGISESDVHRPSGDVELLIGSDSSMILPVKIDSVGNLQLLENQFGYCVRGSHSVLNISAVTRCHNSINHLSGIEINSMHILDTRSLKDRFDNFLDIESLGTHCEPKCGGCKCGKCVSGSGNFTLEEEHELRLIEKGLEYDDKQKCWTVNYPWKRDPMELPNNIRAVVARLNSTERRLQKMGHEYALEYQKQIEDMLHRKVARKLEHSELGYEGPVYYCPHQEVLKPESKSTPLRIVFNSSASYMGHVINDYWAKGPKVMNDLLSVLLKFREGRVGLVGDISKMYNSVRLSIEDQQTHRFLWRDLNSAKPPDHYVLTSVPFGDRPSGAIVITALNKTAEMSQDDYPKAAKVIMNNSYVDDILASDTTTENATQLAKDINSVLDVGGFAIKHWIISGQPNKEIDGIKLLDTETEKILGMIWKPVEDIFTFEVKLNFSRKMKQNELETKKTNFQIC